MDNKFRAEISVDISHTRFRSVDIGSIFFVANNENYYVKTCEITPSWDSGTEYYERDIYNAVELDTGELFYFADFDEVNLVREIVIKE